MLRDREDNAIMHICTGNKTRAGITSVHILKKRQGFRVRADMYPALHLPRALNITFDFRAHTADTISSIFTGSQTGCEDDMAFMVSFSSPVIMKITGETSCTVVIEPFTG